MAIIQVRNVKDLNEGSYSRWGSEKHMYNLAKKMSECSHCLTTKQLRKWLLVEGTVFLLICHPCSKRMPTQVALVKFT